MHNLTPETCLVVSLGPTLSNESEIAAALEFDADFRQPFGYRKQDHFGQFAIVDRLRKQMNRRGTVYIDLPSERPRVGVLATELQLTVGQAVRISTAAQISSPRTLPDGEGCGTQIPEIPIPGLARYMGEIKPGNRVLIRDGNIALKVTGVSDSEASAVVETATEAIWTNNNVVLPDSDLMFHPLTQPDLEMLRQYRESSFAPDWVLLSFVTSVQQIEEARVQLREIFADRAPKIMVKIETAKSFERMGALLANSDGLLVARGDLGVAVAPERLPAMQEDIVRACHAAGKPVLVATQFLQVFADTGVPNRAELSDLALAVRQGVSGILLTKETSGSKFPREAMQLVKRVIGVESQRILQAEACS